MSSTSDRDESEPRDPDADADGITVLTFSLADDRYCVRLEAVDSVVGVTDAGPLADAADPWHAGTVAVEGREVRIVDLPRVLTPATETVTRVDDPALLVLSSSPRSDGDVRHGWLVDAVGVTKTARPSAVAPSRASARLVRGRIAFDDGAAIWLDERAIHGEE